MVILQNETGLLATEIGLKGVPALLLVLLFPVLVALIQHIIERRYDSGQNVRIAKLQAELDATQAKLQTNLEVKSHVTRAQFDVEFNAYREIWKAVVALRISTMALRPPMDSIDINESEEARIATRLQAFSENYNLLSTKIEELKPFYLASVYDTMVTLRDLFHQEGIGYQYGRHSDDGYFEKAMESMKAITAQLDIVAEAIRTRLANVVIID